MGLARESYNYDLYSKEKKGEFQFRKRNIIEEKKPRPYIGTFVKDRIFFVDSFKNESISTLCLKTNLSSHF